MSTNSRADLVHRLHKAEWRGRLRAYALIAPLFVFVAISFLLPLGSVLLNSFHDPLVPEGLPRTVSALQAWDGPRNQVPPEPVFEALALDMKEAVKNEKASPMIARRAGTSQPQSTVPPWPAATSPATCAMSTKKIAPTESAMARIHAQSTTCE